MEERPELIFFRREVGTPWHDTNMRDHFEADGVPGSHSLASVSHDTLGKYVSSPCPC